MLLESLSKYHKNWNLKEQKGLLIIVSGPSGVGKGTIVRQLINRFPENLFLSISVTTRKIRSNEKDGTDYFFKSIDEFSEMIEKNDLLEYACIYDGKLYGTPRKYVEEKINQGKDVILEIDVQGASQVKKQWGEGIFVFVLPPTLNELERRLRSRNTEKEEQIQQRLAVANKEVEQLSEYDYIVINEDIDKTVENVKSIIVSEHCKTVRNLKES